MTDPTFREFASDWFDSHRHRVAPVSAGDYHWALTKHLLPFFADHRLSEITIAEVDRYSTHKLREREQHPKNGGLANISINETLNLLAQVLEQALEYEYIRHNHARGRRRRLKVTPPTRTWLEPHQVRPLLNATVRGLHSGKTMPDPRSRVLFATGICTGLRVGELLALRWREVNLTQGRLTVLEAKTAAGAGRAVDLWPEIRETLISYKSERAHTAPDDHVFGTKTGNADQRSNISRRLKRAIARANIVLAGQDLPCIHQ